MKEYFNVLKSTELFEDFNDKDLESILKCLNALKKTYSKGEILLLAGEKITFVGIVLSGTVHIVKEDFLGNRTIIAECAQGDMFGESTAGANIDQSSVSIVAKDDSVVTYIEFNQIVTTCSSACLFHTRLIENMIKLLSRKNIYLNSKIELLSCRTTREKLIKYFMMQMEKGENNKLTIPFSRDELADFLCVNRSALSRELSNMRDEGILEFNKNKFRININSLS